MSDITPIMKFGKYASHRAGSIPDSYLIWVHHNIDILDPQLKQWLQDNIRTIKARYVTQCVKNEDKRRNRAYYKYRRRSNGMDHLDHDEIGEFTGTCNSAEFYS